MNSYSKQVTDKLGIKTVPNWFVGLSHPTTDDLTRSLRAAGRYPHGEESRQAHLLFDVCFGEEVEGPATPDGRRTLQPMSAFRPL